jgi:hypothetical protein
MRRAAMLSVVIAMMAAGALIAVAQDEWSMLAGFNITVARTEKGVSLTCETGCAWKTIEFSFAAKGTDVNEFGMVHSKNNPAKSSKFLIRFGIEDNGFLLSCERGCAWRTLGWGFRANGVAVPINEYGMANKK